MLSKTMLKTLSALSLLLVVDAALAHVGWRGRDLIQDAISATTNPDGSTTYVYDRGNVTSNWGWADGLTGALAPDPAFDDRGDSHRVRFTKFYLDTEYFVDVRVYAQDYSRNTTDNNIVARLGDLNPGFSIYSGSGTLNNPYHPTSGVYEPWRDHDLVPQSSHDWEASTNAALAGYEGLFNANGTFSMANNDGELNTQVFTGHYAYTQTENSVSLSNLVLGPGWYAVVVGGSLHDGIPYVTNMTDRNPNVMGGTNYRYQGPHADLNQEIRGFGVELTLRPVPVPGAVWLFGAALLGVMGLKRRPA